MLGACASRVGSAWSRARLPAARSRFFAFNAEKLDQEQLSEMLEKDVSEIHRAEVVHCFTMAKTRLTNLLELVAVRGSGSATDTSGGAGSSSDP